MYKEHLQSALWTFVSTVLVTVGAMITSGIEIQWTGAFWSGVLLVAVRAGIKVLVQKYAPEALGGKK